MWGAMVIGTKCMWCMDTLHVYILLVYTQTTDIHACMGHVQIIIMLCIINIYDQIFLHVASY